jgi:ACS family hexuronate transporter-like MFS transporter
VNKSEGVIEGVIPSVRIGRYRWVICALLFLATVINYVDRQMLGVLKPVLSEDLGWSETDYANIVFWFQAAYAVSYVLFGRFIDRIGARWGYAVAFIIWQIAHIAHAGARELSHFIAVRIALGAGEAGSFPAGLKAVTEWFPKRERAFATGIFNAGSNVGAIVTPLLVPAITLTMGWRAAFVITGVVSLLWLVVWLWIYRAPRENKIVRAPELAHIESDPPDPEAKVGWLAVVLKRETWAFALAKFLTDPIWWMFLFWLPDFFAKTYDLDLKSFGPPLVAVYLLADVGSVAGGWLSLRLMRRGHSINVARKTAMLVCALLVTPVVFAQQVDQLWLAVLIIGVAAAAHQGFSANLFNLPGDVFPRRAVASVVGIGGMLGAVGGMLMAKYTGYVLDKLGTYTPMFIVAALAYLIGLAIVHVLSPRLMPVELRQD